ncbi:MAG: J domain-containing protein [Spirochaetales bacterium]|nr:J domain-containing protein [Spirochaetales bacterium]
MLMPLNEEEKRALQQLGVYDCFDTVQLVRKEEFLRRQFRKKALRTHPDRALQHGSDPEMMREAFQNISDSYRLLMDRIMVHKGVSYRTAKVSVRKEETSRKKETTRTGQSVSVGYYKGRFPEKKLRFAEYLYYKKRITWEQLISALSWQFLNRPKLGELARRKGWMTNEQIVHVLKRKKSSQRFGLAAVKQGFLSEEKCRFLLKEQKQIGLPIGTYFTGQFILTEAQLKEHLGQFLLHNSMVRRA